MATNEDDLVDYYGMQVKADDDSDELEEEDEDDIKDDPSFEDIPSQAIKTNAKQGKQKKSPYKTPDYLKYKFKKGSKVRPRSEFQQPGFRQAQGPPGGMKSTFCEICRIHVYYVNPGGWWQHFKKRHGGKVNKTDLGGGKVGDDSDVMILDEKVQEEPELIDLEENIDVASKIRTSGDRSLKKNHSKIQVRLGQPSRSKCNKCHKWISELSDGHSCYVSNSKLDHTCNVHKKYMQFATQDGFDRHMAKYHEDNGAKSSMEVSIQEDGTYQFNTTSKLDHMCDVLQKCVKFTTQDSMDMHMVKYHDGGIVESKPREVESPQFVHTCSVLKKFMQFATQDGFDKHMVKYHNDNSADNNAAVSIQDDGTYQFISKSKRAEMESPKEDDFEEEEVDGVIQDASNEHVETVVFRPKRRGPRSVERFDDAPKVEFKRGRPRKKVKKEVEEIEEENEVEEKDQEGEEHDDRIVHQCDSFDKELLFSSQAMFQKHEDQYHTKRGHRGPYRTGKAKPRKGKKVIVKKTPSPPTSTDELNVCILCDQEFGDAHEFSRHKSLCLSVYMQRLCKDCFQSFDDYPSYQRHACKCSTKKCFEVGCVKVCKHCHEEFNAMDMAMSHVQNCLGSVDSATGIESTSDASASESKSDDLPPDVEVVNIKKEVNANDGGDLDLFVKSDANLRKMCLSINDASMNGIGNGSLRWDKINNPDYKIHWQLRHPTFPNPLDLKV